MKDLKKELLESIANQNIPEGRREHLVKQVDVMISVVKTLSNFGEDELKLVTYIITKLFYPQVFAAFTICLATNVLESGLDVDDELKEQIDLIDTFVKDNIKMIKELVDEEPNTDAENNN